MQQIADGGGSHTHSNITEKTKAGLPQIPDQLG